MKTRHIVHWNGVPSFLSKKERKMAEKTVAVVGSMNCDIILKVKRLPEIGETMVAESAVMSAGGKGANQAAQVAKLGLKTYMVGAVGQDESCEAYTLADHYMSEYFPKWYGRYPAALKKPENYFHFEGEKAGLFRWNTGEGGSISDPAGLQKMQPKEVLGLLFGEAGV